MNFQDWFLKLRELELERCGDHGLIGSASEYREFYEDGLEPSEVLSLELSYADH